MQDELAGYHTRLPVIFIPICLFMLTTYGWIGYATLTERSGLNGTYYLYYNLEQYQFYLYNFVVALIALVLIVAQVTYLIKRYPKYLTRTFWSFALFIVLVIVCESWLNTRFMGKA